MAASVVDAQETVSNTLGTSHVLAVPAGAATGHRILVVANTGKNNASPGMSWAGGFVERMDQTATEGGTVTLSMAELEVSGTPPSTVTVSTVNNSRCTAVVLAIADHDPESPTEIAFTLHSSDPPNLAPSWGSEETLFGAVHSGNEDPFPPPAYMLPDERHEVQGSHTKLYLCMQTLTAASLNPTTWQSGSPETSQRVVATFAVRGATASATDLTVADASQAQTADAPALTQAHALTAQDASQAHAADGVVLTQTHVLVVQDATQASTVDNVTVTVAAIDLVVADSAQAQSVDSPSLSQLHQLVAQDATQPQAADSPALTQAHVLVAGDAVQAQSAESPTLTQLHILTLQDAAQAQVADIPTLAVGGISLVVDGSVQAQTVDGLALTQVHQLTVADAAQTHATDSPILTQAHVLAVQDVLQVQGADSPTLTVGGIDIVVQDALQAQTADGPALTQTHNLTVADAHQLQLADRLALAAPDEVYVPSTITISASRLART